jgi:dTDP-glucose 4,6-dehydratase
MKILVTGGLGTVGTPLVELLRRHAHEVWIADLPHHHDPLYLRCDVSSAQQLERVASAAKFDYVYHLAAEFGRWNGEDYYDTLWRTNVIGTKNVIRWQETSRFRLIFFSSSEVYGDYSGEMSEEVMDRVEVKQLNDYAMTKWVGEMQVLNSEAQYRTETVRVRLFNTYGPGEYYSPYRSVNCVFCYRSIHGLPFTVYRGHHRTSTYIDDTVHALANIVDNFVPGEVYNLSGDEYHDIETLAAYVLATSGADPNIARFADSEPMTTKDKKVNNSRAKRDLGLQTTVRLEEGVRRTVAWMRSVYLAGRRPERFGVGYQPAERQTEASVESSCAALRRATTRSS